MKNTYLLALSLFFGQALSSTTPTVLKTPEPGLTLLNQPGLADPGASLHFDGVDDIVSLGNGITTALTSKNQLTVEAWVFPTANSGNGPIVGNFSFPTANGSQQFLLRRDDDNQYVFFVDDNTGYKGVYSGLNTLVMNTWQHVVGVWNGSTISIYVNGALKSSLGGVTGPHLLTTTNSVAIGGHAEGKYFQGNIDEVRIWSRALCISEITADKNCEVPTTATGLLGNYHFNQGVDNANNAGIITLNDASGNNNNGTLSNFALTGITSNWSLKAGVVSGTSCTPYNGITSVTIASQTNVSCNGKNDGAATLSVIGLSPSYSWAPSGGTAATATGLVAGTYTCTVTSACGGSVPFPVTITEPAAIVSAQTFVLCAGQSVTVGTKVHSVTGIYTDVLKAKNNCDSTVTTNLTVNPAITTSQVLNVCAGQSIVVGTSTYNATGIYTDVLKAKNNCDSTVTTNLTVAPAIVGSQTLTVCAGQSVTVGTSIYTTTGTYIDNLKSHNFCDSTVTTNLTVNPAIASTQTFVLCAGKSVTVGTKIHSVTGVYIDTLKAKNNCDSIITTNLTVNPIIASNQTFIVCAGQTVTVGTKIYNVTGIYLDTLKAKNNCDSIVTTDLTVAPAIVGSQTLTLCAGQSVTVGTSIYSVTGTYIDNLKSHNFCDSTVTTNLTVLSAIDVSITSTLNTITANATGAVYQWIDCNNANTPLIGQINQSYTATVNGNYAVIVTVGSCSDTSICQQIIITGIDHTVANNPAEIYPNPSTGLINLVLSSNQQVVILNGIGQAVYSNALTAGKHLIDLHKEPAGLYTIQLLGNNSLQHFKLIKE